MILITVGTEKFPFNRLMQWIDRLIEQQFIDLDREEVVIQYGSCCILPQKVKSYSLLPEKEFQKLLAKARVIIAHCGEGTFDLLAMTHKPFILVPRSHKFGEHVDDHQIELAEKLSERGVAIANSLGDLVGFLESPRSIDIATTPTAYYARTSQHLETEVWQDVNQKQATRFSLVHWLKNQVSLKKMVAQLIPFWSLSSSQCNKSRFYQLVNLIKCELSQKNLYP